MPNGLQGSWRLRSTHQEYIEVNIALRSRRLTPGTQWAGGRLSIYEKPNMRSRTANKGWWMGGWA